MVERHTDWRALGALAFGACVLGLSPILVRLAGTGPAAAGFWRLALAIPLLLMITWRAKGEPAAPSRMALLAGLFFALDLGFWHYGIRYTSVANATVLSNLAPVVVTLIAWLFLGTRPRAIFVVAVAAAVGGAWLMALAKGGPALLDPALGDAFSASTALWYGLYFLCMSQARRTSGASRLMLWTGAVGAPVLLAAALALGERIAPTTGAGWLICLGLGAMHVAGQGSVAWALGRVSAPTASVAMLLQPIIAAGLGWLLFAEAISPLQALGAAITLSGVALAQWASPPPVQGPDKP